MSKRLIPLLDRVLIRKLKAPEQSIGGIILPESAAKVISLSRCSDSRQPLASKP